MRVRDAAALDRLIAERAGRPIVVALDGRSGTGKSTLASELAHRHGGVAISTDDFFAGGDDHLWQSLAPADRASRVIDWRRLRAEVLEPLRAGRRTRWRTFDWDRGHGLSRQCLTAEPRPVVVLDGAYSARPELADLIDLSVLVVLEDATRRARLIAREGEEYMRAWHALWDGAEDHYFTRVRPRESFDLVIERR